MMQDGFHIRQAEINDVPFLVETIIEAEKSGSQLLSWTSIFGLTEEEAKESISRMLLEEIDGCELSISSFLLAEKEGRPVAALSAWIEGRNQESSAQLKGNLLSYILPIECIRRAAAINPMIHELHMDYTPGSIQKGAGYVVKEFRNQKLFGILTHEIIRRLLMKDSGISSAYTQIYATNIAAIRANEKLGFEVVMSKESGNPEILKYLPSNKKLLLKKELTKINTNYGKT